MKNAEKKLRKFADGVFTTTIVVSVIAVAIGIVMIAKGNVTGFVVAVSAIVLLVFGYLYSVSTHVKANISDSLKELNEKTK